MQTVSSSRSAIRSAAPYVLLTALLCVLASGIGGRALWCDEILRIMGQRMTAMQLLRFEHLRQFCTQTPAAYLFMRPWQMALGMESGGFLLSALCGAGVTVAVLLAVTRLLGMHRPHPLVALVVATNPLLVYYGSELAFYSLWAAAGAAAFALMAAHAAKAAAPLPGWQGRIAVVAAGTLFVSMHFAGLFTWLGVLVAVVAMAWQAGGFRNALRRLPEMLIPVILNLPMYLGAAQAPEHIGSKTMKAGRLASLFPELARYFVEIFPVLAGGWWLGAALLLFGAWRMLHGNAERRRVLTLATAMTMAVVLFLGYTHLREYMPRFARYWTYALAPVLTVLAVGLHELLSGTAVSRAIGWAAGVAILTANSLATGALIVQEGRSQPYKRMQAHLAALAPARTVVSPNYYENRFLGGYYAIPAGGRIISPCAWEEGAEARRRGIQAIWALVPDAVAYVTDADRAQEFRDAGVLAFDPATGFQHRWPWLLRAAWRLHIFPEPEYRTPVAPGLFHRTRDVIAAAAEAAGHPATLPAPAWPVVQFRAPTGVMRFALLAAPKSRCALSVYVPAAVTNEHWHLEIQAMAYKSTRLRFERNGQRLDSQPLPATVTHSLYVPQRQSFTGLPLPEHLLQVGMHFAVQATTTTLRIPLGQLPTGWSTVSMKASEDASWLLLSHLCVPTVVK